MFNFQNQRSKVQPQQLRCVVWTPENSSRLLLPPDWHRSYSVSDCPLDFFLKKITLGLCNSSTYASSRMMSCTWRCLEWRPWCSSLGGLNSRLVKWNALFVSLSLLEELMLFSEVIFAAGPFGLFTTADSKGLWRQRLLSSYALRGYDCCCRGSWSKGALTAHDVRG